MNQWHDAPLPMNRDIGNASWDLGNLVVGSGEHTSSKEVDVGHVEGETTFEGAQSITVVGRAFEWSSLED